MFYVLNYFASARACAMYCGNRVRLRVVHGSILCDTIQPNPLADCSNPTQPITSGKIWTQPDQPNTTNKFDCLMQPNLRAYLTVL